MKHRLIIKALKEAGYEFDRGDGDHDVYEKNGCIPIQVPKHSEVNINTAREILKVAGVLHKLKK